MPNTPDIAMIASLIGDRARAAILMSLMAGRSLTATELARAASVTKQTASSHLSKLAEAQLITMEIVGRHRYFRLADHEVGIVIENLVGLADRVGAVHVRTGPPDTALRKARVCYDHLAGELGVLIFDSLTQQGFLRTTKKMLILTEDGERFFYDQGIDVATLKRRRRPLCLACLDWSVRRQHLAGSLGAAVLNRCFALGWARPQKGTRGVLFSALGERSLRARFTYR
ncbi:MAG: winged helix-turn-helix transcriptional regulator [Gemmatimonadaceae bacterium]|nr:winged helix-turn-helix transcriptional regulator [Gemmatimonadaceae bacterium]MDQ3519121.1 winged helix-turn-helix domain-containing protein [Gemmatimonadota bacterium]